MVDFQSRDTSRGLSDDEDQDDQDDEAGDVAAETGEAAGEPTPEEGEPDVDEDAASGGTESAPDAPSTDERRETDPLAPDVSAESAELDDAAAEDPAETDEPASPGEGDGVTGGQDAAHRATADGELDRGHGGHEHGDNSHAHAHGADVGQLGVAVVTVSSTRSRDTDASGDAIVDAVEETHHEVVTRDVVGDDLDGVQRTVLALTGRDDVDVLVTTGGTGVTPDDVTVEAVEPLFDKDLPGFGELFRILSYEDVGTRALASRATAGVSEGVPVFCLPGSEAAVRLGMDELVTAEMEHLVAVATRED